MTDDQPDAPDAGETTPAVAAEPDWVRRRRLAAVFGDVLPEATSDDRLGAGR